jgi:hypothetical protein
MPTRLSIRQTEEQDEGPRKVQLIMISQACQMCAGVVWPASGARRREMQGDDNES